MVAGALKDKNFITGLLIGLILTFGRAYIPFLEKILSPIFNFWIKVWPTGLLLEIIPLYITGVVLYIAIWFILIKKQDYSFLHSFASFSFGFLVSFIIVLLLAYFAISQFNFTQ